VLLHDVMLDVKEVSHCPGILVMLAFGNFLVGVICFFSNLLEQIINLLINIFLLALFAFSVICSSKLSIC
jgi:uncharacterized membrane protein YjjP (DUF1212 family)